MQETRTTEMQEVDEGRSEGIRMKKVNNGGEMRERVRVRVRYESGY